MILACNLCNYSFLFTYYIFNAHLQKLYRFFDKSLVDGLNHNFATVENIITRGPKKDSTKATSPMIKNKTKLIGSTIPSSILSTAVVEFSSTLLIASVEASFTISIFSLKSSAFAGFI